MSLKDCYPVFRIGNELAFTFVSRDPEGTNPVMKMITYVLTENKGEPYYNLGFGDCHPESDFPDDEAISNNGDMRISGVRVVIQQGEYTSLQSNIS